VGSDNFADAACTVNGSYIESYENGERKLTGTYSNGFKSGPWTHYDESGNTTLSERYESGQLTQIEQTLVETYADGQIKSSAPLTDGARKEETIIDAAPSRLSPTTHKVYSLAPTRPTMPTAKSNGKTPTTETRKAVSITIIRPAGKNACSNYGKTIDSSTALIAVPTPTPASKVLLHLNSISLSYHRFQFITFQAYLSFNEYGITTPRQVRRITRTCRRLPKG
jgi:hypothetical protein